jgi:hypothetical protein
LDTQFYEKVDALLLGYFKINPDELTDEEWIIKTSQLSWFLEREKKLSQLNG